jgi:hypothetical protein
VEARAGDKLLIVRALSTETQPTLEPQATSHDYDQGRVSMTACWRISGRPGKLGWKISLQDEHD